MSYFTAEFEKIIEKSGMCSDPGVYSGRGLTLSDINPRILEKLYDNISQALGTDAGNNFVALVASVQELSATNFLLALQSFERAKYSWKPSERSTQQVFCQENSKSQDMEFTSETQSEAVLLSALTKSRRFSASRESVVGAFLEKYGTREQIQALSANSTKPDFVSFPSPQ